jgi:cell division protein FtsL
VKKHAIAIKIVLLLVLSAAVAIVYGVHGIRQARVHRETACYHANLEKLNSLEPATATINGEIEKIQRDQDVIDQLDGTDDETVIHRRSRMLDGVRLKLTKVNQDRAESQRRSEQIEAELASCLARVK